MPRYSEYPTLYDDVLTIDVSKLKSYLVSGMDSVTEGRLEWGKNGVETCGISFKINAKRGSSYVELDYKCQGDPINYEIPIVKVKSNLGKGSVLYFLCPTTGKRCRKLYCINGYFLHRDAFEGCFYEKQTYSKRFREMIKIYESEFALDECYEELRSKHLKKTYNGKPTKRYMNLLKKIGRYESL